MRTVVNFSESTTRINADFKQVTEIKGGYSQEEVDKKVADATAAGYTDGQKAEYDRFWDEYQRNNRSDYEYAFAGIGWVDTNYNPKYPINGKIASAFRGGRMTNTKVDIVASGSTANAFNSSYVVTIPSIDLTNGTGLNNCFNGASNLENVTFVGTIPTSLNMSACPLTNASVQSAIDHLKDLKGATAQTLTLKADVGAALTEAQKTAISAKNWTLVY
jgi:hypothetical protein